MQIESKADIIKRLGRSPDLADAVVMAWWDDPSELIGQAFAASAVQRPESEMRNYYGERQHRPAAVTP